MSETGGDATREVRPGALECDRETRGSAVVLHIRGEVDMVTADPLGKQLTDAEALASPPAPVVVDMTGVSFMGSVGLALLLRHRDQCTAQRTPLRLVVSDGPVLRLLQVSGLSTELDTVATVDEALNPQPTS